MKEEKIISKAIKSNSINSNVKKVKKDEDKCKGEYVGFFERLRCVNEYKHIIQKIDECFNQETSNRIKEEIENDLQEDTQGKIVLLGFLKKRMGDISNSSESIVRNGIDRLKNIE
jgi:uncharacterized membrane protein YheB (UPF0754 family)